MALLSFERTQLGHQKRFWSGSITNRKPVQVSWKSCCKSKDDAGQVVKDLYTLNKAMLKKFTWRMLIEDSMILSYLRARYLTKDHKPKTWHVSSSVWTGLCAHYAPLMLESKWLVARHSKVHFWKDNWLGSPLIDSI